MKNMKTVLAKATRENVRTEPYPYVVIENAIDEDLVNQLIREFPPLHIVTKAKDPKNNTRFSYPARDVRSNGKISRAWHDFIETHVSQIFLDQILNLLGDEIRALYPTIEEKYGDMATWKAGTRKVDTYDNATVLMDAQICVNTPVMGKPSSVRIAHLDNSDKLYGGLLYLRHPDDNSEGGDLEAYRWKDGKPHLRGRQWTDPSNVEVVARVPYRAGTLVLFINSLNSLHGVTIRGMTNHSRLFMNIIGELKDNLFDPNKHQEGVFSKIQRRVGQIVHS